MNIHNNFKETNYTQNSMDKDTKRNSVQTKENIEIQYAKMERSIDISSLNMHSTNAMNYDETQAQSVLKNIDFNSEVEDFSKQSLQERFSQPLTQAQAHLSSSSVSRLLQ